MKCEKCGSRKLTATVPADHNYSQSNEITIRTTDGEIFYYWTDEGWEETGARATVRCECGHTWEQWLVEEEGFMTKEPSAWKCPACREQA
jgi:hypothetical protein